MEQTFFYILAAVMILATVLAITEKHPVHAIVYLVTSFFALAAIFYLLAAPLVAMFESLASACDRVKARLQAEQDLLASVLPVLPSVFSGTEPARRYGALRSELSDAAIEPVITWTEDQVRDLEALTERLKVADPAAVAKQRRATKTQVAQIREGITLGIEAFGAEGLGAIRALQTQAKAKSQIAAEAAQAGSAQFDGVGSATWRALWDAAKAYSQTAYPGQAFPVTDGARCVLCHQELAADAQHRLRDFEKFIQSKLEAEAQTAEGAYRAAVEALLTVPTDAQIQTQCEAAALTDGAWQAYLFAFWNEAKHGRSKLLAGSS